MVGWRNGTVEAVTGRSELVVRLAPPVEWQARHGAATTLTVTINEDQNQTAVVGITEAGFDALGGTCDPPTARAEAAAYWTGAMERLAGEATAARQRRKNVAQAVIVIHGIGEQVPGATVRAFVQAAADPGERTQVRSKPDTVSPGFELRRWRLDPNEERPTTDFFEAYWASEVRDTTIRQVLSWLRTLFIRPPSTVAPGLKALWWGSWLSVVLLVVAAVRIGVTDVELTEPQGWLPLLVPVVLGVVNGFLVQGVGDAARYLWPHPANVAVRDRVRGNGVALLEALHRSGRYHRIVVVGHSLGSVIAYDIVNHYWIRVHRSHGSPIAVSHEKAADLARQVAAGSATGYAEGRPLQWEAWKEIRRNTQPWLISDLVTMGSPLAHAGMLLATSPADLAETINRLELPSCPPSPPDDIWFDASYRDRFGTRRNYRYFSIQAPFAVTRWTNLFFPVRAGIMGDIVGGPLVEVFGRWIHDQPVSWNQGRLRNLTPMAHTSYWRLPTSSDPAASKHIKALQQALDLGQRRELEDLADAIPPEAWMAPGG